MVLPKTLWEGPPVTVEVDPADMILRSLDRKKMQKIADDYKGVKILANDHIHKEWKRRFKEAMILEIKEFNGDVEILTKEGKKLAFFSGSDEYSGHVNNVWKITARPQKEGYPDKIWSLWTTYEET